VLGGILDGVGLEFGESLLHPSTPKITKPIMVPASKTMFLFIVFLLLLLMIDLRLKICDFRFTKVLSTSEIADRQSQFVNHFTAVLIHFKVR
jgi:hypothetical protein